MPKLPKKELFRKLDAAVISERRASIENYMAKIVSSMPTILRAEAFDQFLQISERIRSIRHLLNANETKALTSNVNVSSPMDLGETVAVTTGEKTSANSTTCNSNDERSIADPKESSTTNHVSESQKSTEPDWSNVVRELIIPLSFLF